MSSDGAPDGQYGGRNSEQTALVLGAPLPAPSHAPQSYSHARMFGACNVFMLLLLGARVVSGVVLSSSPLFALLLVALALLPAAVAAWTLFSTFRDVALTRNFLLSQFLLGAVPLVLIAVVVEAFVGLVGIIPVMQFVPRSLIDKLKNLDQGESTEATTEMAKAVVSEILTAIPLWVLVSFVLFLAYVVAGTVEEVSKWAFARRYRRFLQADGPRIGCKGILMSAGMVALGFAAAENVAYAFTAQAALSGGFSFAVAAFALFRGLIAFPVHIGTQLYVAMAAAQKHILSDDVSVMTALLFAILFHGTIDAIALLSPLLLATEIAPSWINHCVPVIDLVLAFLLVFLVRSRSRALLRREQVLEMPEPV